jgi:KDO2-lipid IV(A) lauroyltransferase
MSGLHSEQQGETAAGEAPPVPRRRRRRSPLRQRSELLLFRLATAILRLLPPASASAFGRGAARLFLRLFPKRRRILLFNLNNAFPEKSTAEIAKIARSSVENFGMAFMDFLDASARPLDQLLSRVTVSGAEHLRDARSLGRGAFLLSAHFGSWEIGALVAGQLGEPIASVVRPLDNALLEGELARRRTRFGNRVIPKREAAREILRELRRGGTVAILVDQNVLPREAVFVPFFGRLAATTPSLALLALKTGAPVVPVFIWPLGNGRYRLEFEMPIRAEEFLKPEWSREERVRQATARYMAVTEAAVRRNPAAWLWMHDRWKTRPQE